MLAHHETLNLLHTKQRQAYFYQTEFSPNDNTFSVVRTSEIRPRETQINRSNRYYDNRSSTFNPGNNSQNASTSKSGESHRLRREERAESVNNDEPRFDSMDVIPKLIAHPENGVERGREKSLHRGRRSRRNYSCGPVLRNAKSENNLKSDMKTAEFSAQSTHAYKKSPAATLSDEDTFQIQLFYSAKGTQVMVCSCLCNLYFGKVSSRYVTGQPPKSETWNLMATGVPVLLLDEGRSRSRPERRLQLILAERGTGYTLWSDVIDSLSTYTQLGSTFHTMLFSNDHQKVAGLRYDNAYAAAQFLQHLRHLAAEPENVSLSAKQSSREAKRRRRHSLVGVAADKSSISTPCCFRHVTSLKPHQLAALDPENNQLSSIKSVGQPQNNLNQRAQSCYTLVSGDQDSDSTRSQNSPNTIV